jgi:D-sedoheptulose 7-phosphate isomerase
MNNYYDKYILNISNKIKNFDEKKASIVEKKIIELKKTKNKIIFFGNGGSAALSNHFSVDFNKNLRINTLTFNETIITCFGNDFGYDNWMKKGIELNANKGDIIVFTSSSGNSANHLKAAKFCKNKNFFSISFTGFNANKLSKITNISFIVNSKNYNIIENTHSIWMLMILDKIKNFKI